MMTSQSLVHVTNFCGFISTFIRPITTKLGRMTSQTVSKQVEPCIVAIITAQLHSVKS